MALAVFSNNTCCVLPQVASWGKGMVAQSLQGAAQLLLDKPTRPALEIEKVTTPGGITIKGVNELEHAGFTSAVIKALKASK